jgi:hypothetical protein
MRGEARRIAANIAKLPSYCAALGEGQKSESSSGGLRSRPINYPGVT